MPCRARCGRELPRAEQQAQSVLRTYGIGAQILKDLGVRRMRVLSAPKQLQGISAFDLEVAEYVRDLSSRRHMPNYKIIDGVVAACRPRAARLAPPRRICAWPWWPRASMPTSWIAWSMGASAAW